MASSRGLSHRLSWCWSVSRGISLWHDKVESDERRYERLMMNVILMTWWVLVFGMPLLVPSHLWINDFSSSIYQFCLVPILTSRSASHFATPFSILRSAPLSTSHSLLEIHRSQKQKRTETAQETITKKLPQACKWSKHSEEGDRLAPRTAWKVDIILTPLEVSKVVIWPAIRSNEVQADVSEED